MGKRAAGLVVGTAILWLIGSCAAPTQSEAYVVFRDIGPLTDEQVQQWLARPSTPREVVEALTQDDRKHVANADLDEGGGEFRIEHAIDTYAQGEWTFFTKTNENAYFSHGGRVEGRAGRDVFWYRVSHTSRGASSDDFTSRAEMSCIGSEDPENPATSTAFITHQAISGETNGGYDERPPRPEPQACSFDQGPW